MSFTQRISIVIPIYYCSSQLYLPIQECLRHVAELKGQKDVIIIDDASPMDHPFPSRFRNPKNYGFTKTINIGLLQFNKTRNDVVIIMNDDITITQECFDRFRTLKGMQIASPMDTASSNDDKFGACWGMTREVYDYLGSLDERYRNFYSDTDYYEQAKKAGVEIIKWRDIVLKHPESSTYKLLNKEVLLEADRNRFELREVV